MVVIISSSVYKLFKYYVIHFDGRGGKPKYNDCIIDGGGGLKTAKNG